MYIRMCMHAKVGRKWPVIGALAYIAIHVCIHMCIYTYNIAIYNCVCACVCVCVRACACVHACVCVCDWICGKGFIHTSDFANLMSHNFVCD